MEDNEEEEEEDVVVLAERFVEAKHTQTIQKPQMQNTKDRVFDFLMESGEKELKIRNTVFTIKPRPKLIKQKEILETTLKENFNFSDAQLEELQTLMVSTKKEMQEMEPKLSIRTIKPKKNKGSKKRKRDSSDNEEESEEEEDEDSEEEEEEKNKPIYDQPMKPNQTSENPLDPGFLGPLGQVIEKMSEEKN